MRVCVVKWTDSAQYPVSEWKGEGDELSLCEIVTVGQLVRETEEMLALCMDVMAVRTTSPWRGVVVIPKNAVVGMAQWTVEDSNLVALHEGEEAGAREALREASADEVVGLIAGVRKASEGGHVPRVMALALREALEELVRWREHFGTLPAPE